MVLSRSGLKNYRRVVVERESILIFGQNNIFFDFLMIYSEKTAGPISMKFSGFVNIVEP